MCIPKRMHVVCHRGVPRGRDGLYTAEADSEGISRLIVAALGCCSEVYQLPRLVLLALLVSAVGGWLRAARAVLHYARFVNRAAEKLVARTRKVRQGNSIHRADTWQPPKADLVRHFLDIVLLYSVLCTFPLTNLFLDRIWNWFFFTHADSIFLDKSHWWFRNIEELNLIRNVYIFIKQCNILSFLNLEFNAKLKLMYENSLYHLLKRKLGSKWKICNF